VAEYGRRLKVVAGNKDDNRANTLEVLPIADVSCNDIGLVTEVSCL
jgi:hypothetical protein